MDTGVALNPVTSVGGYREQPVIAAAPAVPTDLPAPQATSLAVNIPAAPKDSQQTDSGTRGTYRVVIIDPQTNTSSDLLTRTLAVSLSRCLPRRCCGSSPMKAPRERRP